MKLFIKHQESYSRGQLLLRSFFGIFYILIPHVIVLLFLTIGLMFINLFTFFTILFTGKWPKSFFDYRVKMVRYNIRLSARLSNLADGYPAFGLNGVDENTDFDMPYKEEVSRGRLLIRFIFGPFLVLPHLIVLLFIQIGAAICGLIAWFAILFTGKYPQGLFDFVVGSIRWNTRVACYLNFYTDKYPAFTRQKVEGEDDEISNQNAASEEVLDA